MDVRISSIIDPSFYNVHSYLKQESYTHYWFAGSRASVNNTVLTSNYNNLVAMKDIQQQISNSVAAIGNLVTTENAATRQLIQDNYIRELSNKLQTTRKVYYYFTMIPKK